MQTYAVKRLIAADPQTIWNLLTDASNYATWNSAVLGIEGTIAPGERIKLRSTVNPKRAFKLTVTEFGSPRRMSGPTASRLDSSKVSGRIASPAGQRQHRILDGGSVLGLVGADNLKVDPGHD
jgi:uncharacterized protein YndB with AHSA1/START domain